MLDEPGEECGELFGLVSFLFEFVGVCPGDMTYDAWVSMGVSGAACFLSLRICSLTWVRWWDDGGGFGWARAGRVV